MSAAEIMPEEARAEPGLVGIFAALANDARIRLLEILVHEAGSAGATLMQLARACELSRFAVRYHLNVLLDAGLVERRGGERPRYRLARRGFELLDDWILEKIDADAWR